MAEVLVTFGVARVLPRPHAWFKQWEVRYFAPGGKSQWPSRYPSAISTHWTRNGAVAAAQAYVEKPHTLHRPPER